MNCAVRSFLALSIVCGVLAFGPGASAFPSIVWSGIQDIDTGYLPMDLNQDSIVDFLYTFNLMAEFSVTSQGANQAGGPLSAGTVIDQSLSDYWQGGSQTMVQWIRLLDDNTVSSGPWAGIENGYMGLEFEADGQTYYGWARITADYDDIYVVIHEWAYESTPGISIAAGATGVIPEPATVTLVCIGGLGLVICRRRRTIK